MYLSIQIILSPYCERLPQTRSWVLQEAVCMKRQMASPGD